MWIDPGEVVIKLWWSYFQRGVEEVIYTTAAPKSPHKVMPPKEKVVMGQQQHPSQRLEMRQPAYHYQSPVQYQYQPQGHYSPGRYPYF